MRREAQGSRIEKGWYFAIGSVNKIFGLLCFRSSYLPIKHQNKGTEHPVMGEA